jgi:glycerophosphoryl diester phosphodiesterase
LRELRRQDSTLPLGLICETRAELQRWDRLPISFLILHSGLVDAALVGQLKNSKKKILVWTVNHPKDMQRFRDLGVDGIISDDTTALCQTLKNADSMR